MPGLLTTWSYAWQSWRGLPPVDRARALPLAERFIAQAGLSPGFDVRTGWLPVDYATGARVLRRLLGATPQPPPTRFARGGGAGAGTETAAGAGDGAGSRAGDAPTSYSALIGAGVSELLAAAPDMRHPRPWGDLLQLLLDLEARDPAGGRWRPALQSLGIELVAAQDTTGTWTAKTSDAVACTAAVQTAWALERLARARGGDAKLEHAATRAAEWALSKQKTNGYFYSCTWERDPATNPLLTELIDTAEGLLALGLLRDHKHYRAAGLLTARHLVQRVPQGHLAPGAWTSEWNTERHRSPLGTLRLADLCDLASTAPSPEQLGVDFTSAASRLRATLASPPLVTGYGLPSGTGGLPSTIPAWGRPDPFAISTEATVSWVMLR